MQKECISLSEPGAVLGDESALGSSHEEAGRGNLRHSYRLSAVVFALGASIFFQNAIKVVYGLYFRVYPHDILPKAVINVFGLGVPAVRITMFLAALLLMAGLYFSYN